MLKSPKKEPCIYMQREQFKGPKGYQPYIDEGPELGAYENARALTLECTDVHVALHVSMHVDMCRLDHSGVASIYMINHPVTSLDPIDHL